MGNLAIEKVKAEAEHFGIHFGDFNRRGSRVAEIRRENPSEVIGARCKDKTMGPKLLQSFSPLPQDANCHIFESFLVGKRGKENVTHPLV